MLTDWLEDGAGFISVSALCAGLHDFRGVIYILFYQHYFVKSEREGEQCRPRLDYQTPRLWCLLVVLFRLFSHREGINSIILATKCSIVALVLQTNPTYEVPHFIIIIIIIIFN